MACYLTCSLYVTNMIDTCGSPSPYLKKLICSIYYTHKKNLIITKPNTTAIVFFLLLHNII